MLVCGIRLTIDVVSMAANHPEIAHVASGRHLSASELTSSYSASADATARKGSTGMRKRICCEVAAQLTK